MTEFQDPVAGYYTWDVIDEFRLGSADTSSGYVAASPLLQVGLENVPGKVSQESRTPPGSVIRPPCLTQCQPRRQVEQCSEAGQERVVGAAGRRAAEQVLEMDLRPRTRSRPRAVRRRTNGR